MTIIVKIRQEYEIRRHKVVEMIEKWRMWISRLILIHFSYFWVFPNYTYESIFLHYVIFYSLHLWEFLSKQKRPNLFKSVALLLYKGPIFLGFLSCSSLKNILYILFIFLTLNSTFWDFFWLPLLYFCLHLFGEFICLGNIWKPFMCPEVF